MTEDRADRRYLLDRMRLAIITLADGYPTAAQPVFERVYEVLRTQGINADKTVESVVINEDLKFWKGEPFEQALTMFYYSVQQAMLGHWDNARAAAGNALFNLRDFGDNEQGERLDVEAIVRRAMIYEQARAHGEDPDAALHQEDYLNTGYAVRESNFTLGYLMAALANQQLGRQTEADDNYAVVVQINPYIEPLVAHLKSGRYNTVLVVSHGLGPQKVAYGPDGALARFDPRWPSDDRPLIVTVRDEGGVLDRGAYPLVCDVNAMAADHMWNNLEDVRLAKSTLGTTLVIGGTVATHYGLHRDTDEAVYAGLGALVAGLFFKATAHADTRYCDLMPQRFYLVPVTIDRPGLRVDVMIEGDPGSRMVLAGLRPPRRGAQLRYVRLASAGQAYYQDQPPRWAASGRIFYANDATGPIGQPQLPFILGGRCVRTPNEAVLSGYQTAGNLTDMTLGELKELYRAEGIRWDVEQAVGGAGLGRHVLEGGRSMVTPMAGTAGFTRLFGQVHRRYHPRSDQVRQLIGPTN